jgi:two-component system response regulator LytT
MELISNPNDFGFRNNSEPIPETPRMSLKPIDGSSNGKKSFLVYRQKKYLIIPTETIAFFYIKNDTTLFVRFDSQEYFVNYSLDHVQHLLNEQQFFRLNRQYLINIDAIKEIEHYFARKLLVNLFVPTTEKLLVSKEKVTNFFYWIENR